MFNNKIAGDLFTKGEKWFIITLIVIIVLCVLKILSNNLDNFLLSILIYIWIFGTLFMPYIIGIVISAIAILIIRKKIMEKDKNVKILIYGVIIIACVIVCRNLGYPIMLYLSEKPDKVYTEMKELNDSEKLIGLSKEEVIELLGEPIVTSDNMYIYDPGTLTNYLFLGEITSYDLFIWFDENHIVRCTEINLPLGG